jgi:hypothetical protein
MSVMRGTVSLSWNGRECSRNFAFATQSNDVYEAVVKLLLAKDGVDPDQGQRWSDAAVEGPQGMGTKWVVKLLLDLGPKIDFVNSKLGISESRPLLHRIVAK